MARHSWGEPLRFPHKTERVCGHCGMVKVSRHESEGGREIHWQEFYAADGLTKIVGKRTPACERVEVAPGFAAAAAHPGYGGAE